MLEPDGYYWYRELDDEGRINFNCPCAIHGDFATLLFENGAVGNNFLVVRMDGTLMPLHAPAQPLVPDDVMKAIGTLMIEAAGGHEPPYDAPQFPGDKPTEFYLVEKWLDDAQRPSLGDDNA